MLIIPVVVAVSIVWATSRGVLVPVALVAFGVEHHLLLALLVSGELAVGIDGRCIVRRVHGPVPMRVKVQVHPIILTLVA